MSYLKNFKYETGGPADAPKVVFLHGVMGAGANWRRILPAFQRKFQTLIFDQRGHGWSFKPATGYSPEDYSLDLKLILDELGWQQAALVGHSMGGRNALHFAQKYPQRLWALVIEDIGPEGNPKAMQKTIDMVQAVPVPFASKQAAKEYFEKPFVEERGGGEQARYLGQFLYTNIEQLPDGRATWRFSKDAILNSLISGHFKPRWEAVRDLSIPTLFVRGENSEDFPAEEYQRVLAINPRIEGVEIAGTGHWVHFERADEFTAAVMNFLERNWPRI